MNLQEIMRASTELVRLRIETGSWLFVTGDQTSVFIKMRGAS